MGGKLGGNSFIRKNDTFERRPSYFPPQSGAPLLSSSHSRTAPAASVLATNPQLFFPQCVAFLLVRCCFVAKLIPVKSHRGEPGHTHGTRGRTKAHGPHRRTSQPSKPINNAQPALIRLHPLYTIPSGIPMSRLALLERYTHPGAIHTPRI